MLQSPLGTAAADLRPIEKAEFVFGGRIIAFISTAGMDPASTGAATQIVEALAGAVLEGGVAAIMAATEATVAAVVAEAAMVVDTPEATGPTDQAV